MVSSALALARKGFKVIPLAVGSKKPIAGEAWRDTATDDPVTILETWSRDDYNIGVVTGEGLIGLDIDVKGGHDGFAALLNLGLPAGALKTFTVETPSGGLHVYLKADIDLRNSASRLGPGLDVRGAGGYLVGPGSVIGGKAYRVKSDAPIAACPVQLIERARASVVPAGDKVPLVDLDEEGAVQRAISYLEEAPPALQGQGGDDRTFRVAARLKDFGLSEVTALELMALHWNERCEPPWSYEDLTTKVANAYRYGALPPGSDHPAVDFGGVHVEPPPREAAKWLRHGDPWDADAQWLFLDLLPAAGVALLVAPAQAGKTFFALELARCTATGKPFFGVKPDDCGGSLLVYAGTEGSGLARRMAALGETDRLPISAMTCPPLSDGTALTNLAQDLADEMAVCKATHGVPVRLVVLETLAASGLVKDENDNAEVSRALANLAALGRRLGVLLLVSHHPPKSGNGVRGASAIIGSADVVIEIERTGTEPVREVRLTKAREAEQRSVGSFTLAPVELGTDSRGRVVKSLTVSMGEAPTAAQKAVAAAGKHVPLLLECIEWAIIQAGVTVRGNVYAPKSEIWTIFAERCRSIASKGHRNSAMNAALRALDEAGTLELVEYAGEAHYRSKEIKP